MKSLYFLCIGLFSACISLAHNGELLDSLIKAKVAEHHIKSLVITLEQDDAAVVHEIKLFGRNGNLVEHIIPNGQHVARRVFRYDSLDRKIASFQYNEEDTSQIVSVVNYFYVDSSYYYTESSKLNQAPYEVNSYKYKFAKDTIWVENIEKSITYNKEDKTISRYTFFGDSLEISEFIHFDSEGRMDEIDAHYDFIKTDSAGNRIKTSGQCILESDELENITLKEYYENKVAYLQKQLDGEYKYEYGDEIYTYKVFNSKGQLIQDGHRSYDMKTFEYNENNQLVKTTYWDKVDYVKVEVATDSYTYDERGFPVSLKQKNLENGIIDTYRFIYR